MISIRSLLVWALALVLLVSASSAYTLSLTVRGKDNTPLAYSKVAVLQGNTTLYKADADTKGRVSFSLEPGAYFVRVSRVGYPDFITQYTMSGDASYDFYMLQGRSTYTLLGQLIDEPAERWDGAQLRLIDTQKGPTNTVATVVAGGYFLFPYLNPAQTYRLRLEPTGQTLDTELDYTTPDTFYLAVDLRQPPKPIALTGPASAEIYQRILVTLTQGGEPLANQTLTARTPRGLIELTTDERGQAGVQAAQAGRYEFIYGDQRVTLMVAAPAPAQPAPAPSAPTAPEPSAPPSNEAAPLPPPPANTGGILLIALLGLGLLATGVGVALVVLLGPHVRQRLMPPPGEEKVSEGVGLPAQSAKSESPAKKSAGGHSAHKAKHRKH